MAYSDHHKDSLAKGILNFDKPDEAIQEAPVIVTFLDGRSIDLPGCGIHQERAAELRNQLMAFAEEWDSPEMQVYDDYDAAKSRL